MEENFDCIVAFDYMSVGGAGCWSGSCMQTIM